MANTYRQNDSDGARNGYFTYSINPDLGQPVFPGDSVTVSGTVYCRDYPIKSIGLSFNTEPWTSAESFIINASIGKGKTGKFTFSFKMPDIASISKRITKLLPAFSTYDLPNAEYSNGGISTAGQYDQEISYLKYKLLPNVSEMDFARSNIDGTLSNEGLYFKCRMLKVTINSAASAEDITIANIKSTRDDGQSTEVSLNISEINLAISEGGYVESVPQIFKDESSIGSSYTITLTIGDEFEQVVYVDNISRAFANIHLSGVKTGGVALGMFSTSAVGNPKFESAYPAHLYGGFGEETVKILSNVIYPVGSVFFCTDEITPSDVFGGKWEQIKDRFIVAAGSSYSEGSTGGSATHSFSATHRHLSPAGFDGGLLGVVNINDSQSTGSGRPYASINATHTGNLTRNIALGYTANATVSASVDTIPPYIAICVWKRIELYDVNADMTISNTMKSVRRLSHEQLEDK